MSAPIRIVVTVGDGSPRPSLDWDWNWRAEVGDDIPEHLLPTRQIAQEKIDKLRRLADRAGTSGEREAALAAIERLLRRV